MIGGRYSLREEVGRGGMGAVWLAHDETLGRSVALKRLGMETTGDADQDLARAEREARLAAMLNHPNVVAVFDLVVDDGQRWLVMEYVPSVTLAALVRREGPLSPDQAAPLLGQAADALAAAHDAGIVHRDVKPSNILITSAGRAKLTDFGIARAQTDASLTRTGLVTGSPAYLAPEVASGKAASYASDVWSLGATLFHALAGRPPFEVGENVVGALYKIVHEEPPRIDDRAGWLATLLRHTMATDPEDRWSMTRVRDELRVGPGAYGAPADGSETGTRPVTRPLATGAAAVAGAASALRPGRAGRSEARNEKQSPPAQETTGTPQASEVADDGSRWTDTAPRVLADDEPRSRSRAAPALIAAAVLVVLAVVLGVVLGTGGDESAGPSADQSTSATPSPSESPTESESPQPTAAGMRTFIQDYVSAATSDRRAAFQMLTPGFQRESGGFSGYSGFWGKVADASVSDIRADPGSLTVSYDIDYVFQGGRQEGDSVQLSLVFRDGQYLIAGES